MAKHYNIYAVGGQGPLTRPQTPDKSEPDHLLRQRLALPSDSSTPTEHRQRRQRLELRRRLRKMTPEEFRGFQSARDRAKAS
jgi:hypothetical protein